MQDSKTSLTGHKKYFPQRKISDIFFVAAPYFGTGMRLRFDKIRKTGEFGYG